MKCSARCGISSRRSSSDGHMDRHHVQPVVQLAAGRCSAVDLGLQGPASCSRKSRGDPPRTLSASADPHGISDPRAHAGSFDWVPERHIRDLIKDRSRRHWPLPVGPSRSPRSALSRPNRTSSMRSGSIDAQPTHGDKRRLGPVGIRVNIARGESPCLIPAGPVSITRPLDFVTLSSWLT